MKVPNGIILTGVVAFCLGAWVYRVESKIAALEGKAAANGVSGGNQRHVSDDQRKIFKELTAQGPFGRIGIAVRVRGIEPRVYAKDLAEMWERSGFPVTMHLGLAAPVPDPAWQSLDKTADVLISVSTRGQDRPAYVVNFSSALSAVGIRSTFRFNVGVDVEDVEVIVLESSREKVSR